LARFNKLDVPYQWKDEFTKYPHGYTIFEALCKWVKQVDDMVDNVNNWNDYLDNFVENFEFELQEEVQSTITRWQNEGLLDDIISSALTTELDNVTAQLADVESQLEDVTLNARYHFGMVGDGSDETEKFQNALNESAGKKLFLPKPQTYYYIGKISIPSYTTLIFDEGIEIVGKPLKQEGFSVETERLINIIDVTDVVIRGNHSTIRLEDKSQYTQEWNHIFNIQSSNNVYIYDISANDSGGDGFYVGDQQSVSQEVPKNINLINCKANNNRRQGLSIISVDGFYAENCEFNNTVGTAPEAGIDIEPNFPNQKLKNIKFVNCSSIGNKAEGVKIQLHRINATTEKIDIQFINFHSKNNGYGYVIKDVTGVQGVINFVNCVSEESRFAGFVERGKELDTVKTIYTGCKSINDNVNGVSHTTWQYANGAGFAFLAEKDNQTIGNSYVYDCFVIDTRTTTKVNHGIAFHSKETLTGIATDKVYVKNLHVDDGIRYIYEYNQTQNINVSLSEDESQLRELAIPSHSGSSYRSVYAINTNRIITNKGATGSIRLRLTQPFSNLVYRFRVDEPFNVEIDTTNFGILGVPEGSRYRSNTPGSYLVLKGTNEGYYTVIGMVGEWTIV